MVFPPSLKDGKQWVFWLLLKGGITFHCRELGIWHWGFFFAEAGKKKYRANCLWEVIFYEVALWSRNGMGAACFEFCTVKGGWAGPSKEKPISNQDDKKQIHTQPHTQGFKKIPKYSFNSPYFPHANPKNTSKQILRPSSWPNFGFAIFMLGDLLLFSHRRPPCWCQEVSVGNPRSRRTRAKKKKKKKKRKKVLSSSSFHSHLNSNFAWPPK